jgi:hypothetical protein
LTSALDGVTGQRHAPAVLSPREWTPGTHLIGGWAGLRAGLDTQARGIILSFHRESSPACPVCSETLYWLSCPRSTLPYVIRHLYFIICLMSDSVHTYSQWARYNVLTDSDFRLRRPLLSTGDAKAILIWTRDETPSTTAKDDVTHCVNTITVWHFKVIQHPKCGNTPTKRKSNRGYILL